MENLRSRVTVRLDTNAKDYQKLVSKLTFISQKISSKICLILVNIQIINNLRMWKNKKVLGKMNDDIRGVSH